MTVAVRQASSTAGGQSSTYRTRAAPMPSADGRFVLSYMARSIITPISGGRLIGNCGPLAWRGHGDTEKLVDRRYRRWDPRAGLQRCVGMFDFVVWDVKDSGRSSSPATVRTKSRFTTAGWGAISCSRPSYTIQRHRASTPNDAAPCKFRRDPHKYVPAPLSIYGAHLQAQAG